MVNSRELKVTNKCDLLDGECKKLVYQHLISKLSFGSQSLGIPQIEPMELNHEVFTLPNSLKLTLEEGIATGLKSCVLNKLQTVLEEPFHTTVQVTCNIEINGVSIIEVPKSVIEEVGGKDIATDVINGRGKVKITMEGLHFCLNMPFTFEWKNNDVYLLAKRGYFCDVALGSSTLFIENLDMGNKINSEKISDYLKDKTDELNIKSPIANRTLIFFQSFVDNYLAKIPAKSIYTTAMSSF